MILATVLLFIAAQGLLFYRWVTVREPNSVLVVIGSEALRGAEVKVEGVGLHKPYQVKIGDAERLTLPFYLDRGTYTLTVTMNGETIYHLDFNIAADYMQQVDLSKFRPPSPTTTTAP